MPYYVGPAETARAPSLFNVFDYDGAVSGVSRISFWGIHLTKYSLVIAQTRVWANRMWANAQRDGRPAEHRWRPLFNATKFGWCPQPDCRVVTLPRRESR